MIEKEIDPETWTISPSQLNQFNNCEYQWYLDKVVGISQPPNAAMTRGSAYHKAVEDLWKYNIQSDDGEQSPDGEIATIDNVPFNLQEQPESVLRSTVTPFGISFRRWGVQVFEDSWKQHRARVDQDAENYDNLHDSSLRAFLHYVDRCILTIESLVSEKRNTYASAYKQTRPFVRERKVYSRSKGEVGVIDYVFNTQYGRLIGDWKTGHPYGSGHNPDYYNQLAFYAYLDNDINGEPPSSVEINYVLHGLQMRYDVTPEMIEGIRLQILRMRKRLAEVKSGDKYEKNILYKFCKSCSYGNLGMCDRKP